MITTLHEYSWQHHMEHLRRATQIKYCNWKPPQPPEYKEGDVNFHEMIKKKEK